MKFVFFCVSAALLFTACKKTDPQASREDQLRGTWKQTAGTVTSFSDVLQRDSVVDYWKTATKCQLDNTIKLGEGFGGEANYGKEQCFPSAPQSETLTWQVKSNDTVLEVNNVPEYFFGANPMRGAIQELSGSSLKIRYAIDSVNPSTRRVKTYTFLNTYIKQ